MLETPSKKEGGYKKGKVACAKNNEVKGSNSVFDFSSKGYTPTEKNSKIIVFGSKSERKTFKEILKNSNKHSNLFEFSREIKNSVAFKDHLHVFFEGTGYYNNSIFYFQFMLEEHDDFSFVRFVPKNHFNHKFVDTNDEHHTYGCCIRKNNKQDFLKLVKKIRKFACGQNCQTPFDFKIENPTENRLVTEINRKNKKIFNDFMNQTTLDFKTYERKRNRLRYDKWAVPIQYGTKHWKEELNSILKEVNEFCKKEENEKDLIKNYLKKKKSRVPSISIFDADESWIKEMFRMKKKQFLEEYKNQPIKIPSYLLDRDKKDYTIIEKYHSNFNEFGDNENFKENKNKKTLFKILTILDHPGFPIFFFYVNYIIEKAMKEIEICKYENSLEIGETLKDYLVDDRLKIMYYNWKMKNSKKTNSIRETFDIAKFYVNLINRLFPAWEDDIPSEYDSIVAMHYLELAIFETERGATEAAEKYQEVAKKIFEREKNEGGLADSEICSAQILMTDGNFAVANQSLLVLFEKLEKLDIEDFREKRCLVKYTLATLQEKTGEHNNAMDSCNYVKRFTKNKELLIKTLHLIGIISFKLYNFKVSIESFIESYTMSKNIGSKFYQCDVLLSLGNCYMRTEKYDKALKVFKAAEFFANQVKQEVLMTKVYYSLGLVYTKGNKHVNIAKKYMQRALKDIDRLRMREEKIVMLYNLGRLEEESAIVENNLLSNEYMNLIKSAALNYEKAFSIFYNRKKLYDRNTVLYSFVESKQAIFQQIIWNMKTLILCEMAQKLNIKDFHENIGINDGHQKEILKKKEKIKKTITLRRIRKNPGESIHQQTERCENLREKTLREATKPIIQSRQKRRTSLVINFLKGKYFRNIETTPLNVLIYNANIVLKTRISKLFSFNEPHFTVEYFYNVDHNIITRAIKNANLNINLEDYEKHKDEIDGKKKVKMEVLEVEELLGLVKSTLSNKPFNISKWEILRKIEIFDYMDHKICDIKKFKELIHFKWNDPHLVVFEGEIISDENKENDKKQLISLNKIVFRGLLEEVDEMGRRNKRGNIRFQLVPHREIYFVPFFGTFCEKYGDEQKGNERENFFFHDSDFECSVLFSKTVESKKSSVELIKKKYKANCSSFIDPVNIRLESTSVKGEESFIPKIFYNEMGKEKKFSIVVRDKTFTREVVLDNLREVSSEVLYFGTHYVVEHSTGQLQFGGKIATSEGEYIYPRDLESFDFHGTKLVFLNSCQTSLGNVCSGGPLGVWRAFIENGAESCIVTQLPILSRIGAIVAKNFGENMNKFRGNIGEYVAYCLKISVNEAKSIKNNENYPFAWSSWITYTTKNMTYDMYLSDEQIQEIQKISKNLL